jgi:lipopolysaccharide export system permease protein
MPTKNPPAVAQISPLRRLIPKRIDYYIGTEVTGPFLGGIIFFSFIFLMFQALRLAEALIEHSVPISVLFKMVGLMILSFLPMAIPLAFLIAMLVGFGRLSADSELVAMKANGMSIHRLAAPALVMSVIVGVLSLGLNLEWVPKGKMELKRTLLRLTNTKAVAAIREGTFTSGFFDLLVYADKVDHKTNRLEKVFIYDERNKDRPLTVVAQEGEIVPVKIDSDLGASAALKLYNGNIHSNDIAGGAYQKIDFREYQLYLKVEAGADTATGKPTAQPYHVLKRIARNEPDQQIRRGYRTEIFRRWMTAIAPLLFVLIGIGYGTVRTRAVRANAGLVTLGVIIPYYVLQTACESWGYKGYLPPAFAMAIPNLILFFIGLRSYRRSTW